MVLRWTVAWKPERRQRIKWDISTPVISTLADSVKLDFSFKVILFSVILPLILKKRYISQGVIQVLIIFCMSHMRLLWNIFMFLVRFYVAEAFFSPFYSQFLVKKLDWYLKPWLCKSFNFNLFFILYTALSGNLLLLACLLA